MADAIRRDKFSQIVEKTNPHFRVLLVVGQFLGEFALFAC
jgi:hypothetical protein